MESAKRATIRPALRADFPAVVAMLGGLADHIRPGLVPLVTTADLARYGPDGLGLFELVIATRDGRPRGLCLYTYLFSGWRGRPGLFINDLYVEPEERGFGLGKEILAAVARREASKDCGFIKLEVDKANGRAIGFYQRLGFALDDHDHTMIIEGSGLAALRGGA